MLENLFISVLNMSIISGYVIIFVLIARLLLKKTPKIFSYALWGIVLFRLLCPFSFESVLSLMPMTKTPIPKNIIYSTEPQINTGIAAFDSVVNPILPVPSNIGNSVNPIQIWLFIGAIIWAVGMLAMVIYSVATFVKLKRSLIGAAQLKENIYLADHISSPFVMGLFKPKIYLPSSLSDSEKDFITLHEICHIRRFDHATRILGFVALAVHWFNPLVWIAFILSGKDMELSCDEAVMKKMNIDIRVEYSQSLLRFGTSKRMIHATPLAFGENNTKNRIKNVLNYKKPAFWVLAVSVVAVVAVGIGLTANPKEKPIDNPPGFAGVNAIILKIDIESQTMLVEGVDQNSAIGDQCILDWSNANLQTVEADGNLKALSIDAFSVGDYVLLFVEEIQETYPTRTKATTIQLQELIDFTVTNSGEESVSAEYTMMKLGKNGEVLSSYSLKSKELANAIIMDALVKSAAWEGMDVSTLEECYLIRQSFTEVDEIHDYYAYRLADGTSVLQSGTNGRYSTISSDLYLQLVDSFKSLGESR